MMDAPGSDSTEKLETQMNADEKQMNAEKPRPMSVSVGTHASYGHSYKCLPFLRSSALDLRSSAFPKPFARITPYLK